MDDNDICSVCKLLRPLCLEHLNLRTGAGRGGVFLGIRPQERDVDQAVHLAMTRAALQ